MARDGKLAISQRSARAFLEALGEKDRFELISFNVAAETLFNGLSEVSPEALERAGRCAQAAGLTTVEPDDAELLALAPLLGPVLHVDFEDNEHTRRLTGEGRAPDPGLSDAEIARRLGEYDGAHGFDPVPSLRALDVPALWLLGERDRSIPVPEICCRS